MGSNAPTLVDLFAGCGGVALGFHDAGFKTMYANEMHPDPALTYSANLLIGEEEKMIVGKVEKVFTNKIIDELGIEPFTVTCVAGGPPCQGFSNAGRNIASDPRNKLYRQYLRVIRKIKPKSVLFENVPGFCKKYGLNLQQHLVESLEKIGYKVDCGNVFAHDYGVPQLRERFILIGVHKKFLKRELVSLPSPTWSKRQILTQLTSRKVLSDLDSYLLKGGYGKGEIHGPDVYLKPATTKYQKEMRAVSGCKATDSTWNTKIPKHTKKVQKRMGELQKGRTLESFKDTDLETDKQSQRVLFEDQVPRITVVSIPDDYVHYNKKMPRTFSVRECARLQSFPDHFRIHGKRTTGGDRRKIDCPQYTQVGNAVPPRLAKAMADQIRYLIDE